MTNLHGGWEAGASSLAEHVSQAGLSRAILLSDGNANEGLTNIKDIAADCARLADLGVTTSTYGLGRDFNEELMVSMAKAGQGNHYYGETAKDLFEPFADEFDLIANLYARQLRLSLGTVDGVQVALLNDYALEDLRGFPVARLPDLAWGAEAWALVELKVSAPAAGADHTTLLQVEVTGVALDGKPVAFPAAQLKLPAVPANAWEALLPDSLVQQRMNELEAAKFLDQARSAAERGDWKVIEQMLEQARQRFADNPWVQQVLANMVDLAHERDTARFSKEAMFSSRRMNSRLSAKEEAVSMLQEAEAPAFLRRKAAQGKAQYRRGPEDNDPSSKN
jgi:Ca-activated chloride channel family protein